MANLNLRKAEPMDYRELQRDFRPIDVLERDMLMQKEVDGLIRLERRRARLVTFVAKDRNRTMELCYDLGPATGAEPVFVPCSQQVEMAHLEELLLHHEEVVVPQEAASRRARQPEEDHRFRNDFVDQVEDDIKRVVGLSTFGPGGQTTRESP